MRLDKYLKVSRLIKRRTIAKEVADQGRVQINGQTAKSSSIVKVGDHLTIKFGNRIVMVEVLEMMDSTKKQDAQNLYRVLSEQYIEKTKTESHEFLA